MEKGGKDGKDIRPERGHPVWCREENTPQGYDGKRNPCGSYPYHVFSRDGGRCDETDRRPHGGRSNYFRDSRTHHLPRDLFYLAAKKDVEIIIEIFTIMTGIYSDYEYKYMPVHKEKNFHVRIYFRE
jgi:hypothetical protein